MCILCITRLRTIFRLVRIEYHTQAMLSLLSAAFRPSSPPSPRLKRHRGDILEVSRKDGLNLWMQIIARRAATSLNQRIMGASAGGEEMDGGKLAWIWVYGSLRGIRGKKECGEPWAKHTRPARVERSLLASSSSIDIALQFPREPLCLLRPERFRGDYPSSCAIVLAAGGAAPSELTTSPVPR